MILRKFYSVSGIFLNYDTKTSLRNKLSNSIIAVIMYFNIEKSYFIIIFYLIRIIF